MTDTSQIEYNAAGDAVGFIGDAVEIYRAALCASSLGLLLKTGIKPCRGVGKKQLLAVAGGITGKTYKGTQGLQAIADLHAWVQVAKLSVAEVTRD